jgi:hypothetical protein
MSEVIVWGTGLLIGLLFDAPLSSVGRTIFFFFLTAVGGSALTVISGEFATEPALVLVDIGQAAIAALLGCFARRQFFERLVRSASAGVEGGRGR